jgi:hypothetical protein
MSLLYKKCEVCETDINKLQKWWNIYMLKAGAKLKCQNCGTEYKTNKPISIFGAFYTWSGISIFVLIIATASIWKSFEKIFDRQFGGEIWLYTFFIYSLMELLVMVVLPLNIIKNKEEGKKDGN